MKTSTWLVNELIKIGVKRVYMVAGGFSMHLNDSFDHSDLQVVQMLDERAAGFAACAEAQYTGRISVAVTTAGPGSTNILTAVASAWCDSLPLLVISGEINTQELEVKHKYNLREGSAQDVDMMRVARPIVKYVELALNPIGVKWIFKQAVKFAMEGRRGPTWMILPLNVQAMIMENENE
jgi:acetolactate synthase-1/2/3 large subunit